MTNEVFFFALLSFLFFAFISLPHSSALLLMQPHFGHLLFPCLVSYEYAYANPVSAPQAARVSSFKTCSSLSRFQDALSLMTRVDYMSFENTTETFCHNCSFPSFHTQTHSVTRPRHESQEPRTAKGWQP